MVGNKEITVYFIKGADNNPTASNNRHAAIIKMMKMKLNAVVLEQKYISQKLYICKIINAIIFQIRLMCLALKVPKSRRYSKKVVFLFSINPFVGLGVKVICCLKGNKLVIERNEFPEAIREDNRLKQLLFTWFVLSWQYKLYDGLFLMTDKLIDFYSKYSGKKCIIKKLPMTVDMKRFEGLDHEKKENYFAYAGSLSNSKDGIIHLINVFKKVSANFSNLYLKIAGGRKHEVKQLNEYIIGIGLENKVNLLGLIPSDEIPSLLYNAYALVLPRPDTMQAQGGFPTKLGEFLATGKPVIVTKVGEISQYLDEDEVFFISPENIEEELVNTVEMVLTNYQNAIKVGIKGQQKAFERFSLEANAAKVAELITNVAFK